MLDIRNNLSVGFTIQTITGNVTAQPFTRYFCLSRTVANSVTLPVNPLDKDIIQIMDMDGNAATYNVTVLGNGKNIDSAGTKVLSTNGFDYYFIFSSTLDKWISNASYDPAIEPQLRTDVNTTKYGGYLKLNDNISQYFGTNLGTTLTNTGTTFTLQNSTGSMQFHQDALGSPVVFDYYNSGYNNMLVANPQGAVDLYYNGTKTFSTSVSGVTVTGDISGANPTMNLIANSIDLTCTNLTQNGVIISSGGILNLPIGTNMDQIPLNAYLGTGAYIDIQDIFQTTVNLSIEKRVVLDFGKFGISPEGGMLIRLINKTGTASVKGSVISVNSALDNSFILQTNEYDTIGFVYENGIADGSLCWVVTSGIGEVLLEDGTSSTAGNWVHAATTNGRADASLTQPSGAGFTESSEHFKELGHCLESVTSGTNKLAKIAIHLL